MVRIDTTHFALQQIWILHHVTNKETKHSLDFMADVSPIRIVHAPSPSHARRTPHTHTHINLHMSPGPGEG